MAQTINTNVASLNAQRNLSSSQSSLGTTLQRLSSGLRVNSAKDDAAGLAIAERMNAQVKGMNVAIRNASDAISLSQTAEGALGKMGDSLQRMRELAVQSANGTNTSADRDNLQLEFAQLQAEITRLGTDTKFNEQQVLKGTEFTFQVGANKDEVIKIKGADITAAGSETSKAAVNTLKIDGADATESNKALEQIDKAIAEIVKERATFGAAQVRFESVVSNLQVSAENQASARGRIMDADFATETANLSRTQILQQAGTAMLAQANSLPQNVLSLLR
ncbi:MAG TPA: flagellin [Thauera sp.]|uniref:flagellin N-terminal helical domain-containing protein n=1 Tax=Thauera sp. TaxID=1905334 RepID=UPI002BF7DA14|nr:flagellin [Thauera sp.]HRP22728.1 flagellin [Thauera sp.]HRP67382.1 flagellin [Thauera sp.]